MQSRLKDLTRYIMTTTTTTTTTTIKMMLMAKTTLACLITYKRRIG
jgi:hypothetical protein